MSLSDGWQSVIRLDERSYQWSQDPAARLNDDFRVSLDRYSIYLNRHRRRADNNMIF